MKHNQTLGSSFQVPVVLNRGDSKTLSFFSRVRACAVSKDQEWKTQNSAKVMQTEKKKKSLQSSGKPCRQASSKQRKLHNSSSLTQSGGNARQLVHPGKAGTGETNQCNLDNWRRQNSQRQHGTATKKKKNPSCNPCSLSVSRILSSVAKPHCLSLLFNNLFYFFIISRRSLALFFPLPGSHRSLRAARYYLLWMKQKVETHEEEKTLESKSEQTDIMMFTSALLLLLLQSP